MIAAVIAAAYLIGSIPFALILSRRWGADLRSVGSGNLGAANVHARVRGHRRRAGRRARHGQGRRERLDGGAAHRRRRAARGRRARRDCRSHLSDLAAVSRRQGRGDRVRRVLGADAARRAAGPRAVRARGLVDAVHLARIGAGGDGAAASCLRDWAALRRSFWPRPPRLCSSCSGIDRTCFASGWAPSAGWGRARSADRCGARRRQLGHGAGRASRPRRTRGQAVGAGSRRWSNDMSTRRANAVYLPDVPFPPSLTPTHTLADALGGADLVVSAVPSHGCRAVMQSAAPSLDARAVIVSATKGLEAGTLLRMSEVIGAGGRRHASGGGAVGAELRLRGGAGAADRDPGGVAGCRGDRPRPAGIPRTVLPPVRQRRCRRRRDRRGDEEHHRDCGRRGRRTGARPQRAGGADHARARRAHAAGLRRRRTSRDARRAERPRRSGADLHRQPEPQPARRHRTGPRPRRCRRSSPA